MAKGDGSILPVKDSKGKAIKNCWRLTLDFGRNPQTGKRERLTKVVHGTKTEAARALVEMRKKRESGMSAGASKSKFGDISAAWLRTRKADPSLGKDTVIEDERIVRCLNASFADQRIGEITPLMVEGFYFGLLDGSKSISGRPLSASRAGQYYQRLNMVFKYAVSMDILFRNPCERVKQVGYVPGEQRALSEEESACLAACVSNDLKLAYQQFSEKEERVPHGGSGRSYLLGITDISRLILVRLAIATGMRRGELLALTWADISLDDCYVRVSHSLTRRSELKAPKTRSGLRTICIDEGTVKVLDEWRSFELSALQMLGPVEDVSQVPVICSASGGFSDGDKVSRWWRKWCSAHGFEGLKFHGLRHSHASLLVNGCGDNARGISIKTVQERLGHSSVDVTLNIYTHSCERLNRSAAKMIGSVLN